MSTLPSEAIAQSKPELTAIASLSLQLLQSSQSGDSAKSNSNSQEPTDTHAARERRRKDKKNAKKKEKKAEKTRQAEQQNEAEERHRAAAQRAALNEDPYIRHWPFSTPFSPEGFRWVRSADNLDNLWDREMAHGWKNPNHVEFVELGVIPLRRGPAWNEHFSLMVDTLETGDEPEFEQTDTSAASSQTLPLIEPDPSGAPRTGQMHDMSSSGPTTGCSGPLTDSRGLSPDGPLPSPPDISTEKLRATDSHDNDIAVQVPAFVPSHLQAISKEEEGDGSQANDKLAQTSSKSSKRKSRKKKKTSLTPRPPSQLPSGKDNSGSPSDKSQLSNDSWSQVEPVSRTSGKLTDDDSAGMLREKMQAVQGNKVTSGVLQEVQEPLPVAPQHPERKRNDSLDPSLSQPSLREDLLHLATESLLGPLTDDSSDSTLFTPPSSAGSIFNETMRNAEESTGLNAQGNAERKAKKRAEKRARNRAARKAEKNEKKNKEKNAGGDTEGNNKGQQSPEEIAAAAEKEQKKSEKKAKKQRRHHRRADERLKLAEEATKRTERANGKAPLKDNKGKQFSNEPGYAQQCEDPAEHDRQPEGKNGDEIGKAIDPERPQPHQELKNLSEVEKKSENWDE
ncbi:hypothetical protein F4779DRAFT_519298 [Xylariaceae sp. FL0662B]|nr:hypothetical protein F4779DRAFT_519298 [Xylariaceae sp. FL0662B]